MIRNYDTGPTGQAISIETELQEYPERFDPPTIATLNRATDHKLIENKISEIYEIDNQFIRLEQSSNPPEELDRYVYLEWPSDVDSISIYMKGENGNPYFELWAPDNNMVLSGKLPNNYKWYTIDVSSDNMKSDFYALYNYEWGGTGQIIIEKVVARPEEKPGIARITGA